MVTPRLLATALWANNTGGEALDSAEAVRAERMRDEEAEAESQERMAADDQDDERAYDPAASTERLLSALGLAE